MTVSTLAPAGRSTVNPSVVASPTVNDPREWDRAMMARVCAGDDLALRAIFDRYAGAVHAVAAQLTGPDLADDVTQQVFLGLWDHPERYDASLGGLRAFLSLTARRRAIDLIRSRNRRAAREHGVSDSERTHLPTIEAEALAAVIGAEVRSAVRRLPEAQRRAIELAYLAGLTFREVARVMGCSEGTAKSRLRLGLGKLARELEHERDGVPEWN